MNKSIKIAVCDDSADDRRLLTQIINEYLEANAIAAEIHEFCSGEALLQGGVREYSLAFLDIFMDRLNGMETAKRLIAENETISLVFCSSSRDFAAESYDVSALYYIIKPVERAKLNKVLDRFFNTLRKLKTLTVKLGRSEQEIYINDIVYAEASNKRTLLHTRHGTLEVSMPFSFFCAELKEPDFVRTIRYALVSVREIVGFPSETVRLSDGTILPISRGERKHVRDVFVNYMWKTSFLEGERQ